MSRATLRNLTLLWLTWALILVGYMQFAAARFAPARADHSLNWTEDFTDHNSLDDKHYLTHPFWNTQVAWDSEYYLSIALVGYDDPEIYSVAYEGEEYTLSHAFFPLYPLAMRYISIPLQFFGMSAFASAVAAGVLISVLGTLGAVIALFDITRDELGKRGALRAVFYMLIFPSSVFLSVLYTEGLFLGLAFGSLALMQRRRFVWAAILAALATWTRSIGAVLVMPMLINWGLMAWEMRRKNEVNHRNLLLQLPILFLPVLAYGVWSMVLGHGFHVVESEFFINDILALRNTASAWVRIFQRAQENPATVTIIIMQLGSLLLALLSVAWTLRKYPALALFGLAAIMIPTTSGWTSTQSTLRYVLAVPTLFIMLGQWGRYWLFDRAWTMISILLLGMNAFLLSYDFWVA